MGYGSHFDPKIALSRALTEVNQILPSVLSVKAEGTTNYPQYTDPLAINWWQTATLTNHPYLIGDRHSALTGQSNISKTYKIDLLHESRKKVEMDES